MSFDDRVAAFIEAALPDPRDHRAGTTDQADGLLAEDPAIARADKSLLRFGVNDAFELRLGFNGFAVEESRNSTGGRVRGDGFRATTLGFKLAFNEEKGAVPQAAFLGTLFLPSGSGNFATERADPAFRFLFSNTLNERLSLGYNLACSG